MGDCSLIRFFKMLKKLEILPKLVELQGPQRLRVRLGQEYPPSDHSARRNAAATAIGAREMLWTAEAVEDLKKLALAGKERKPHLRGARRRIPKRGHRQGEPDRDQTQWRGRGADRARKARARPAPMGDRSLHSAQRRRPRLRLRPRSRSPGRAGGGEGGWRLWRSRDRRDATAEVRGNSRIRLSLAARRSEKRRVRLLRAHAGRRASPIAPAIAGWPIEPPQARPIARERQGLRAIASSWRLS